MKLHLLTVSAICLGISPAFANPVQINKSGSPAQAQVYGDNSGANANRNTNTNHNTNINTSHSNSGVTKSGNSKVNVTTNVNTGGGGKSLGASASPVSGPSYGGGNNYNTVAPSIGVPSITGQASCSGGVSIGGIGMGGGGSGGGMWEFHDCKVPREAITLYNMGYKLEAIREMCQQIDRVKQAFGGTCPGDQSATKVSQTTQAFPNDYCETRNAGDKNQHYECESQKKQPVVYKEWYQPQGGG